MNNNEIATEFKTTLSKFNKGITGVTIDNGMVSVSMKSKRACIGVMTDLLRSRAFRSVVPTENNIDGGFMVHACK